MIKPHFWTTKHNLWIYVDVFNNNPNVHFTNDISIEGQIRLKAFVYIFLPYPSDRKSVTQLYSCAVLEYAWFSCDRIDILWTGAMTILVAFEIWEKYICDECQEPIWSSQGCPGKTVTAVVIAMINVKALTISSHYFGKHERAFIWHQININRIGVFVYSIISWHSKKNI